MFWGSEKHSLRVNLTKYVFLSMSLADSMMITPVMTIERDQLMYPFCLLYSQLASET